MNRLHQAWIWLRRMGHCRGFGIQSPSDYRLVRYVINEHWPYYAYDEIGRNDDRLHRKLGQLYFRLANDLQPDTIVDLLGYEDYLHAGCHKATIIHHPPSTILLPPSTIHHPPLTLAPATADISSLIGNCQTLVVEGIAQQPDSWRTIIHDERATVTFDLYYCGIAFFVPSRTKQHYIINF